MLNITSFNVACFINKKFFKNDLNLTIFVQIFLNKTGGQTWGQKKSNELQFGTDLVVV
jgi:hypothetical protein